MNAETIDTTKRQERGDTPTIAEARIGRTSSGRAAWARAARGSLRGGWQSTNGTLTCRWIWVEPRPHREPGIVNVAA